MAIFIPAKHAVAPVYNWSKATASASYSRFLKYKYRQINATRPDQRDRGEKQN